MWEASLLKDLLNKHFSTKLLLLGYGNLDRQDDGVAWHILSMVAKQMGYADFTDPDKNFELETATLDLRFLPQLTPEIAENLANYSRVCFIDACANPKDHKVSLQLQTAQYQPSILTHHISPASCLYLCEVLVGVTPQAYLLSIPAYKFNYSRELSTQTKAHIDTALTILSSWLESEYLTFPIQNQKTFNTHS